MNNPDFSAVVDLLPDANPEAVKAELISIFHLYEQKRVFSTDTISKVGCQKRLKKITDNLQAALNNIDPGPSLSQDIKTTEQDVSEILFVRHLLDLPDKLDSENNDPDFRQRLRDLLYRTDQACSDLQHEGVQFDEFSAHRRTRTASRDRFLIPRLVEIALRQGHLFTQPLEYPNQKSDLDWDELDTTCEFVKAALEQLGINAPDPGDTAHGEQEQGRLRRMIKKIVRKLLDE